MQPIKIKEVKFIDQNRIEREYKKVEKKYKKFKKNFDIFKNAVLDEDHIYNLIRPLPKKWEIMNKIKCDKKVFWKHYIKDDNYKNMIRVMFFIKTHFLYIIELYHHKDKKDCDYALCQKYCDF